MTMCASCSECRATKCLGQRTQHREYGLRCLDANGHYNKFLHVTRPAQDPREEDWRIQTERAELQVL